MILTEQRPASLQNMLTQRASLLVVPQPAQGLGQVIRGPEGVTSVLTEDSAPPFEGVLVNGAGDRVVAHLQQGLTQDVRGLHGLYVIRSEVVDPALVEAACQ